MTMSQTPLNDSVEDRLEIGGIEEHPSPRLPVFQRARSWSQDALETLLAFDLFELGARMTLVMLLLSLHETTWYINLGVVTLAVTGLVLRPLLRNPLLWLGLAAVLALAYSQSWYTQNNHDFLKLYWCLAVGCSLLLREPSAALRMNARVLIGLCFAFAFLWKMVSADYVDDSFFTYFLLQDSRFALITDYIAGLDPGALLRSRIDRVLFTEYGDPALGIAVPMVKAVASIAPLMTWWTLFIEGLVAAAFLVPTRVWLSRWRDAILLVFILSTYFVAPILYFAWIIMAMGVVQCNHERFRYVPAFYVAALLLILMRFYVPV